MMKFSRGENLKGEEKQKWKKSLPKCLPKFQNRYDVPRRDRDPFRAASDSSRHFYDASGATMPVKTSFDDFFCFFLFFPYPLARLRRSCCEFFTRVYSIQLYIINAFITAPARCTSIIEDGTPVHNAIRLVFWHLRPSLHPGRKPFCLR